MAASPSTPSVLSPRKSQAPSLPINVVDGFEVEEPAPAPKLPDSLLLLHSDMCRLDALDFVDLLYKEFSSAFTAAGAFNTSLPPTRIASLLGLDESRPSPKYLPEQNRISRPTTPSGRPVSPSIAALQLPALLGATQLIAEVMTPNAPSLYLVRQSLAKALGGILDEPLQADFGHLALTDVYLDLLHFGWLNKFTAIQLQQLLLLFRDTHSDISWMESENDVWKVADALERRLARLCNEREAAVVETKQEKVVVMEERIDPVALAQFEVAKKDAKGKKAAQLTEATLPRIQVPVEVVREIRHGTTLVKPPYFSKANVLDILDFFQATLFQHWRLYKHILVVPRGQNVVEFNIVIEDPAITCTPLAEAITLLEHDQRRERQALLDQYVVAASDCFHRATAGVAEAFQRDFAADALRLRKLYDEAEREDQEARMSNGEFRKTVEVLVRRIGKTQIADAAPVPPVIHGDAGNRTADWYADVAAKLERIETTVHAKLDANLNATAKGGKK